jgi:hypothetical protein
MWRAGSNSCFIPVAEAIARQLCRTSRMIASRPSFVLTASPRISANGLDRSGSDRTTKTFADGGDGVRSELVQPVAMAVTRTNASAESR